MYKNLLPFPRIKAKFETNCHRRDSRATARHIIQSNTIVTDITNANVEIILGLRKLGGQILKTDPPSQSEIIERAVLRDEEARKLNNVDNHTESKKIGGITLSLDRRMSLG